MAAYIIANIEVTDPEGYPAYLEGGRGSAEKYGGKYIVRGGKAETLEGERQPHRTVVLEFPSVEQARAWWDSPEYSAAKPFRRKAATSSFILVEGVEERGS